MSESNTPSSTSFHVALERKATFFGRSNWISVTWSCQCCAMQLSRQRQRWTQCGSASSSWCSPCIFPSHLLPLALHADHANYVAHKHRRTLRHMLSLHTDAHICTYIWMYVRIWTRSAVTIWPCVWVMQWDRQAAQQSQQGGKVGRWEKCERKSYEGQKPNQC